MLLKTFGHKVRLEGAGEDFGVRDDRLSGGESHRLPAGLSGCTGLEGLPPMMNAVGSVAFASHLSSCVACAARQVFVATGRRSC